LVEFEFVLVDGEADLRFGAEVLLLKMEGLFVESDDAPELL
jgi:hypothetical protein